MSMGMESTVVLDENKTPLEMRKISKYMQINMDKEN